MVVGLTDPMVENFQNPNDKDVEIIDYYNDTNERDDDYIEEHIVRANSKNKKHIKSQDNNPSIDKFEEKFYDTQELDNIVNRKVEAEQGVEGEMVEGETEIVDSEMNLDTLKKELRTRFENDEPIIIEGFNGSVNKNLSNDKLLLKSILFGLIFYILSHPKTFELTKPITQKMDKLIIHTIVFILIVFCLNSIL